MQEQGPWLVLSALGRPEEEGLFVVAVNKAGPGGLDTGGLWPFEQKLVPKQSGPTRPAALTFSSDFFSKALAMTLAASTPTVLPSRRRASRLSKSSISFITSLAVRTKETNLRLLES